MSRLDKKGSVSDLGVFGRVLEVEDQEAFDRGVPRKELDREGMFWGGTEDHDVSAAVAVSTSVMSSIDISK